MKFRKAIFQSFLLSAALALLLVTAGEGFFHRHHGRESEENCAYCHWCHTASQAVVTAVPPSLFPLFFVFLIVTRTYQFTFVHPIFHRGRAPPVNFRLRIT